MEKWRGILWRNGDKSEREIRRSTIANGIKDVMVKWQGWSDK